MTTFLFFEAISNSSSDNSLANYVINVNKNTSQQRALRVSTNKIVIMALTLMCCQSFVCILLFCIAVFRILQHNDMCLIEICKRWEDTFLYKGLVTTVVQSINACILILISMYSFLMTQQVKLIMCSIIKPKGLH